MNSWIVKDMNKLTFLVFIAFSVSLALLFTIPDYVENINERIEILEEKIEILEGNNE